MRSFRGVSPRCRVRVGAAALAVLGCAALSVGPVAGSASAAGAWRIIDVATGRCLDSNFAGDAYTSICNGGAYQEWYIYTNATSHTAIENMETGLFLDSNYAGNLYTDPGNGGNYQSWNELFPNAAGWFAFQDNQTGLWLDSNSAGNAYTGVGNGGAYQSWEVTG
jgi:hypothetical protein